VRFKRSLYEPGIYQLPNSGWGTANTGTETLILAPHGASVILFSPGYRTYSTEITRISTATSRFIAYQALSLYSKIYRIASFFIEKIREFFVKFLYNLHNDIFLSFIYYFTAFCDRIYIIL